ncbi:MAG: ATP-dependent helicase, partial [Holophagae bacterium]|nr:ATP-dependent helicase [Holophagae bacterium]
MKFHRLDKARDKHFWSIRVSSDIRLILHKTEASLLLCYVGHHDKAYRWAERRKLEIHPKTGAAQFVEIRELVKEIVIPVYVEVEESAPPLPALFADMTREAVLAYGVPDEWVDDVRQADEDSLLEVVEHLPGEAAEALLALAVGGTSQVVTLTTDVDPFEHPDAQRRFRVMTNVEELEQALAYPWEKWAVFLHPTQRELVERSYNGPARVSGSAGTGKTVVALDRAVYLAQHYPDSRLLLATFSNALASSLQKKLRCLCSIPSVLERIEVCSIMEVALRLHRTLLGKPRMIDEETLREMIIRASEKGDAHRFSESFLFTEWREVVDAWQLDSWDSYRDVARLGRKTRLAEKQRKVLWEIFDQVRAELMQRKLLTEPGLFAQLISHFQQGKRSPYDYAVIDEAQDISVSQLRFLAALGRNSADSLFFAGDLGQRIFQTPFSWKSLGVDIRGRSRTLRINYRTSHQIRRQADRLLPREMADIDGNTEDRRGTVSVFNGPEPLIQGCDDEAAETCAIAEWLGPLLAKDFLPHEIGLFVRSSAQISRARQVLD